MQHRPLALVSVLAGGDYLLWNWSLQGSHDVLALISGLTLPPLALALIWLLGLSVARGLAQVARAPRTTASARRRRGRTAPRRVGAMQAGGQQAEGMQKEGQAEAEGELAHADSPSSKLAA